MPVSPTQQTGLRPSWAPAVPQSPREDRAHSHVPGGSAGCQVGALRTGCPGVWSEHLGGKKEERENGTELVAGTGRGGRQLCDRHPRLRLVRPSQPLHVQCPQVQSGLSRGHKPPGPPFTHILLDVDSFEPKYMYLERKTSSMKSLCVGLKSAPHWEVEGLQIPLQRAPVAQWPLSSMGSCPLSPLMLCCHHLCWGAYSPP